MKPIKVALLVDSLNNQYAGIYTYASELCREFVRDPRGCEFVFLVEEKVDFLPEEQQIVLPKKLKVPGARSFHTFVQKPSVLASLGVDIVHDVYHIAPFMKKLAPYKRVVTIHDLTTITHPEFHVWRGPLVHKIALPHIFDGLEAVIAVSESTKKDIQTYYPHMQNIDVIPLAGKTLPPAMRHEQMPPYILCVATLEPRKNIEILVQAFALIADRVPHRLRLVGKVGWKKSKLLQVLEHSPVRDRIDVVGYLDDALLADAYANADCFVYPSQYEGFGMPVLEAMHYGAPVILAQNSSLVEVGGHAAEYFTTGDAQQLSEKMYEVVVNREKRENMGISGKHWEQHFSWKKTADATVEVYKRLME